MLLTIPTRSQCVVRIVSLHFIAAVAVAPAPGCLAGSVEPDAGSADAGDDADSGTSPGGEGEGEGEGDTSPLNDLYANTQEELEANVRGRTRLDSVRIGGTVTDLSPLAGVEEIASLAIIEAELLTSTAGLVSLRRIDQGYNLHDLPLLTDLADLPALESIGALAVSYCPALTAIDMPSIVYVDDFLSFEANQRLCEVSFPNLVGIGGYVTFTFPAECLPQATIDYYESLVGLPPPPP